MHYKMLEGGLINSMQFFQRIVYEAVFDLKKNNTDPHQYFRQKIFEDLDDYIFYMFRLYQATQARMNKGLANTMYYRVNSLVTMAAITIVILGALVGYWLWRLHGERMKLATIWGYFVIYPVEMVREIKVVQQVLLQKL